MAGVFKSGVRPDGFDQVYEMAQDVAGLFRDEAKSIWDFIRGNDILTIAEIGRNLGSGIFLFACAARNLRRFLSIDMCSWPLTDEVIPGWAKANGFDMDLVVCDSMDYEPDRSLRWDFVFIDGGHTGQAVKNDLEKFRGIARYIGFHDFADMGRKNAHKRVYKGVVKAIVSARDRYGWVQACPRVRSEVIFDTGGQHGETS